LKKSRGELVRSKYYPGNTRFKVVLQSRERGNGVNGGDERLTRLWYICGILRYELEANGTANKIE
jgi:hypothetical protein